MPSQLTQRITRKILLISFFVTLAAGSSAVWMGFVVSSSALVQSLNYTEIGILTVVCGCILVSISFSGLYGIYKSDIPLLIFFTVSSTLVSILLLLMGGFVLHIKSLSGEVLMSQNTCLANFQPAETLSQKSAAVLCSLNCPCELSPSLKLIGYKYQGSAAKTPDCSPCENIQMYEYSDQAEIVKWVNQTLNFSVSTTACAVTQNQFADRLFTPAEKHYIEFLSWMEDHLSCSGMCSGQNIFLFSNVSKGLPDGPCYLKLKVWASESFLAFGVSVVCFAGFQLLASAVCLLYIVRTRKNKAIATETLSKMQVTEQAKDKASSN